MQSETGPTSKAWRWLLLNLLVLPGWGSIRGGRRRSGYCQLALGITGAAITLVAVVELTWQWVQAFQMEQGPDLDPRLVWWTVAGVVLFGISWFWALATSIELIREAASAKPPPILR